MLPLVRQNAYRARYKQLRPGWRTSGDVIEALVQKHIHPEAYVLDVGSGRGGVMELFWRDVKLTVGLDPDQASLAERREPLPAVCGRGETIPAGSAAFDLVVALWVLEHLPQPGLALKEIRRVLRPGGRFLFLTPNALHPLIWGNQISHTLPRLQRALIPWLYGRSEADTFHVHYRANTPARLRSLATECRFRCAALHVISDPTYLAFNDVLFQANVWMERLLPRQWGVHLVGEWIASE